MIITDLSDEELNHQIDVYKNRIETLSDHLEDLDDARVIPLLRSQLDGYRSNLSSLYNEVNNRSTTSKPGQEIGRIYFQSKSNSFFRNGDLITRSFGNSTIQVSEKGDLFEVTLEHQTQKDLFTCSLKYPIELGT